MLDKLIDIHASRMLAFLTDKETLIVKTSVSKQTSKNLTQAVDQSAEDADEVIFERALVEVVGVTDFGSLERMRHQIAIEEQIGDERTGCKDQHGGVRSEPAGIEAGVVD